MWTVRRLDSNRRPMLHKTGRSESERVKEDVKKVNVPKVEGPKGKFWAMRIFILGIFFYFCLGEHISNFNAEKGIFNDLQSYNPSFMTC